MRYLVFLLLLVSCSPPPIRVEIREPGHHKVEYLNNTARMRKELTLYTPSDFYGVIEYTATIDNKVVLYYSEKTGLIRPTK